MFWNIRIFLDIFFFCSSISTSLAPLFSDTLPPLADPQSSPHWPLASPLSADTDPLSVFLLTEGPSVYLSSLQLQQLRTKDKVRNWEGTAKYCYQDKSRQVNEKQIEILKSC